MDKEDWDELWHRRKSDYTPADVARILSSYRRLSHGFSRREDADLSAEVHVAVEVLRAMGLAGMLKPIEVSVLVGRFLLLQTQDAVALELDRSEETVRRVTKSGLKKMADGLNGLIVVPRAPRMRLQLALSERGQIRSIGWSDQCGYQG